MHAPVTLHQWECSGGLRCLVCTKICERSGNWFHGGEAEVCQWARLTCGGGHRPANRGQPTASRCDWEPRGGLGDSIDLWVGEGGIAQENGSVQEEARNSEATVGSVSKELKLHFIGCLCNCPRVEKSAGNSFPALGTSVQPSLARLHVGIVPTPCCMPARTDVRESERGG